MENTCKTKKIRPLHVVMLNFGFSVGGIENVETKLIGSFLKDNVNVTLFCSENSHLPTELQGVSVVRHTGILDLVKKCTVLLRGEDSEIFLCSFHPRTAVAMLCIASRLVKLRKKGLHIFHWVSHSRAFFFSQNPVTRSVLKRAFFTVAKEACFFMNVSALRSHEAHWRTSLKGYPVVRIIGREPVQTKQVYNVKDVLQIASVGRLVPFKAYNLNAPSIIRSLLDQGQDATWDIWGYGPDEQTIKRLAREFHVSERIRLHGTLDHNAFDETVSKYDVFVGMGTAAIEAAKIGVPTVLAVENSPDSCYGFLSEAPGDSVGDKEDGAGETSLLLKLTEFANLSAQQREDVALSCQESALAKESTVKEFSEVILNSPGFVEPSISSVLLQELSLLYLDLEVKRREILRRWKQKVIVETEG